MRTVHFFFIFFLIIFNATSSFSSGENIDQGDIPEFFDEENSPKIVKKFLKEYHTFFQEQLSSLETLWESPKNEQCFHESVNLEKLSDDLKSFKERHELLRDHGEGFYVISGQFYKFWHDDFDIETPPTHIKILEEFEKIYNDIFDLCESLERASRYNV